MKCSYAKMLDGIDIIMMHDKRQIIFLNTMGVTVGCFSGQAWKIESLKVADYELPPIQAIGSSDNS